MSRARRSAGRRRTQRSARQPARLVTVLWWRTARARTTVHSGVVALMIPAVDEFTVCSATANSRYGTALANKRGDRDVPPQPHRARYGLPARQHHGEQHRRAKGQPREGDLDRGEAAVASLIHRNADPQIRASSAMRGARVHASLLFDGHVVQQAGHVAAHHEPGQLVGLAVLVDAGVPDIEHRHARAADAGAGSPRAGASGC